MADAPTALEYAAPRGAARPGEGGRTGGALLWAGVMVGTGVAVELFAAMFNAFTPQQPTGPLVAFWMMFEADPARAAMYAAAALLAAGCRGANLFRAEFISIWADWHYGSGSIGSVLSFSFAEVLPPWRLAEAALSLTVGVAGVLALRRGSGRAATLAAVGQFAGLAAEQVEAAFDWYSTWGGTADHVAAVYWPLWLVGVGGWLAAIAALPTALLLAGRKGRNAASPA